MKNFWLILIICLLSFWAYVIHTSNQMQKEDRAVYLEKKAKIPVSDPNRVVDGWDYENNTYLYKDQRPTRKKFNDANSADPYPDFYVAPIQKSETQLPEFIWIGDKKYRLRYRSNGQVELEEQ